MGKLEERMNLFRMEMDHQEAPRVPVLSNFWTWKFVDGGYKLSEAVFSMDILKKSMYEFHEKYNFDAYYETNFRNPLFISQAMGGVNYVIDDERNALSYVDQCLMDAEDYDELIRNPEEYLWTKYVPRKYHGASVEKTKNALGLFAQFLGMMGEINSVLAQKYEVPGFMDSGLFPVTECLGCGMRGLKELSVDIRRCPDKVEQAIAAMDNYFKPIKALYYTTKPGRSETSAYDVGAVFLSHTLMNHKAFERFYLPFLREMTAYLEAFDKTGFLFLEGDNTRLWDYFKDLPKNKYMLYLESDDIYAAKKYMGDTVALAGGLKSTTLGGGTPEQCVDEAKRAVDILGVGGGFIVTTDKMMSYTNDCRSENLKAVNEFLTGYYK